PQPTHSLQRFRRHHPPLSTGAPQPLPGRNLLGRDDPGGDGASLSDGGNGGRLFRLSPASRNRHPTGGRQLMSLRWGGGAVAVERLEPTIPVLGSLRGSRIWEAMVLLAALAAFGVALGPALRESG